MNKSIVTGYRDICFFCGRQADGEHHQLICRPAIRTLHSSVTAEHFPELFAGVKLSILELMSGCSVS